MFQMSLQKSFLKKLFVQNYQKSHLQMVVITNLHLIRERDDQLFCNQF